MRTAITTAKTTGGDWKILSSPEVPIHEQKLAFSQFRMTRVIGEFSEVCYQESDGIRITHKFYAAPSVVQETVAPVEIKTETPATQESAAATPEKGKGIFQKISDRFTK